VSKLVVKRANRQDAVEDAEHVESVSQPPVIITEQEVAFSTAAALGLPREKPSRSVLGALRARLRRSSEDAPPTPRHYPPRRDEFLEGAAMAREMHRL
jgi:hypothetical protein